MSRFSKYCGTMGHAEFIQVLKLLILNITPFPYLHFVNFSYVVYII